MADEAEGTWRFLDVPDGIVSVVSRDEGLLGWVSSFLEDPATDTIHWALVSMEQPERRFSRWRSAWVPLHQANVADGDSSQIEVPYALTQLVRAARVAATDEDPDSFLERLEPIYGSDQPLPRSEDVDVAGRISGLRRLKRFGRLADKRTELMFSRKSIPSPRPTGTPVRAKTGISGDERDALIARARRELPELTGQAREGISGLRRLSRR
jgi:hypothetical protein